MLAPLRGIRVVELASSLAGPCFGPSSRRLRDRHFYGTPLVNSTFTLALVIVVTGPDTSENAAANLGSDDMTPPASSTAPRFWGGGESSATSAATISARSP